VTTPGWMADLKRSNSRSSFLASVAVVYFLQLVSCVGPAIRQRQRPIGTRTFCQPVVATISIDLQDARELFQKFFSMFTATSIRIKTSHARGITPAPTAVITGERPKITGFGLAPSRVQHRGGGFVYYPAGDCVAICREGVKSLVEAFICSASRSTIGGRWNEAFPSHPASVERCKSRPERL